MPCRRYRPPPPPSQVIDRAYMALEETKEAVQAPAPLAPGVPAPHAPPLPPPFVPPDAIPADLEQDPYNADLSPPPPPPPPRYVAAGEPMEFVAAASSDFFATAPFASSAGTDIASGKVGAGAGDISSFSGPPPPPPLSGRGRPGSPRAWRDANQAHMVKVVEATMVSWGGLCVCLLCKLVCLLVRVFVKCCF